MITKKQFKLFVNEHQKWVKKFGLFPWKCNYHLSGKSDDFRGAWNRIEFDNQLCDVYLERDFKPEKFEGSVENALKRTAKHEALHILLAPLWIPLNERFIDRHSVGMANEDLVRRLEELIQ